MTTPAPKPDQPMPDRTDPGCPLAACMALLGGAWTPAVLWHLSVGRRRFCELRSAIPAISAKVLTHRLRDLEEKGVILRHADAGAQPPVQYELTALGAELVPVLHSIARVGRQLQAGRDQAAGSAGPVRIT